MVSTSCLAFYWQQSISWLGLYSPQYLPRLQYISYNLPRVCAYPRVLMAELPSAFWNITAAQIHHEMHCGYATEPSLPTSTLWTVLPPCGSHEFTATVMISLKRTHAFKVFSVGSYKILIQLRLSPCFHFSSEAQSQRGVKTTRRMPLSTLWSSSPRFPCP